MNQPIEPDDISPPLGAYAHGVLVPANARQVVVSGQVGVLADGSVPEGIEAQLEAAWNNILSILRAADMSASDIVKVTTFVTDPEHFKVHPRVRARMLGGHRAAATALCVSALAAPEYLCEIDVVAAKSARSAKE